MNFLLNLGILCALTLSADAQTRIVGGEEASIIKHSHQVSLRYRPCVNCAYAHHCGGSIYNEQIIITAAHCINNRNPEQFLIVAGSDNRRGAEGAIARARKFAIHEQLDGYRNNDIALIFLETPLPLNGVNIAALKLADEEPTVGKKATATGWGTDESGFATEKLHEMEVTIMAKSLCEGNYEGVRMEGMLCADVRQGNRYTCSGDAGGPLVVARQLAGIVVLDDGCSLPNAPGVYASVAKYNDWILHAIAEDVKEN